MRRITYLLVKNRPHLQRIILPYLRSALRVAHSDLIVYDDGDNPEVERLARTLDPIEYVREPNRYEAGHERTWTMRGQYAAMYEDAQRRGLPKWVVLDDDVLPGPRAIVDLHEATVTPEWPTVMPFATRRLDDAHVHDDGYLSRPKSEGLIDCAFVVHTGQRTEQVAKIDPRGVPNASRLRMPQIEMQHLGFLGGTGTWHDSRKHRSPWILRECVDPYTGHVVGVRGFDLRLYAAAARRYAVEELAAGDVDTIRTLCQGHDPYVYRATLLDDVVLHHVVRALTGYRRLLVLWEGLWQGNRTRDALGIPARSRYIKLWPARSHTHEWIQPRREKTRQNRS